MQCQSVNSFGFYSVPSTYMSCRLLGRRLARTCTSRYRAWNRSGSFCKVVLANLMNFQVMIGSWAGKPDHVCTYMYGLVEVRPYSGGVYIVHCTSPCLHFSSCRPSDWNQEPPSYLPPIISCSHSRAFLQTLVRPLQVALESSLFVASSSSLRCLSMPGAHIVIAILVRI